MDFLRYQATTLALPELGLSIEYGRMSIGDSFFNEKQALMGKAFAAMKALEAGAIANPDENRMVGHYWLRAPQRAPNERIRGEIETTLFHIVAFVKRIHKERKFKNLLVIGIGGSALGPQFIAQALGQGKADKLKPYFFDNTDPDGFDTLLNFIELKKTLIVVISKSGSTPETRNGMLEAKNAFRARRLNFAKHAIAITQEGSQLDQLAKSEGWMERFPMWDYVGGRTSVASAVGLLPMALQGIDIGKFIEGAAAMDEATRTEDLKQNPAAILALCWLHATGGVGAKAMVVLPYKDRLSLLTRYLQQLVMESLGKATDLDGKRVHQGLTVYGNKGSTDQHAYVQQLRDGLNNFFLTFIEVLKERGNGAGAGISDLKGVWGAAPSKTSPSSGEGVRGWGKSQNNFEVDPGVTSGDYLQGFCLGTAVALEENFRQSMTLTLDEISPRTIGALIALFERAVGFYATLINVNAYHQPGVEAGKKAAASILTLKQSIVALLEKSQRPMGVVEISQILVAESKADIVYRILERLCANPGYVIKKSTEDKKPFNSKYRYEASSSIFNPRA